MVIRSVQGGDVACFGWSDRRDNESLSSAQPLEIQEKDAAPTPPLFLPFSGETAP